MRIIWQTVRRIYNKILGVKGLTLYLQYSILQIGCENRQGHLQSIHSNELFLLIDKEMFIGESGELLNGSWESKG